MNPQRKIPCLAVDDEPPALDIIRGYIDAIPSLQLIGTCENAVEALSLLKQHSVELIFLDIQMPQILGTEFIRTLKNAPKVIFTTAYRKFAIEGFELDAIDYLLKPISFERFLKAVNRVLDTNLPVYGHSMYEPEKASNQEDPFISVRVDRKNIKIALSDILYIESLKDYVKIVTPVRSIITKHSITSLEENLPVWNFLRIHRSFIVSLRNIQSFTSEYVEINKQEIPISRMYRHEVAKRLKME
jgi:DNA-binding LytR/AlgR family response regulator